MLRGHNLKAPSSYAKIAKKNLNKILGLYEFNFLGIVDRPVLLKLIKGSENSRENRKVEFIFKYSRYEDLGP